jgi:catechol 2,3-dioxygenase-like lactoylglutathione lyase family enzyme
MTDRTPILDHLSLPVTDVARARAFYEAALEPLGLRVLHEPEPGLVGFGTPGNDDFYLATGDSPARVHLAFGAADRAAVDAFHAAALRAGGTDNGAPGLRPAYHPDYYGAYVLDPDGNNVEAVCHTPPAAP